MLQFNKVILHNFGSYGHAELDLRNKGFCLVSGENHFKSDNALSNGSGKSFIWSAICFAITGETINGLHTNLRNINADESDKDCFVSLAFQVNLDTFILTRYITPNSNLKIIKNNEDVSGKGIRESEKILKDLLPDLTKDLIASTIIIGQGMPNKFSSFSPSGRKELLEKLTKSDFMIDDLKHRVATRQSELNNKIRTIEDSLLVNKTVLAQTENNLKVNKEKVNSFVTQDYTTLIAKSEARIKVLTDEIKGINNKIMSLEKLIDLDNKDLVKVTSDKMATQAKEVEAYNKALNLINTDTVKLDSDIHILTEEIKRLKAITDICPMCGQKLVGVEKPDTTQQELLLEDKKNNKAILVEKLNSCTEKHIKYTDDINNAFADKILELNNNIAKNKTQLTDLKANNNLKNEQLRKESEILNSLQYGKQNDDFMFKKLKEAVKVDEESVARLKAAISLTETDQLNIQEHAAVVKKMDTLIKRDFRGYLLSNIIVYINRKAKEYCNIVFGTKDLDLYLDGNALDISYCGKMFDNLSGGEKQRVDLILQFAIRDMLISYLNMNSNILVLDEITDFLDKKSCSAVMSLIEHELNNIESVFIISHHAEELELPIDSKIKIIKNEKGISEVY